MKFFSKVALGVAAGALLLASCATQSAPERSAARQRSASSDTFADKEAATAAPRQNLQVVMAAAPAPAAPQEAPAGGDAAKGKEVFDQCAICHNVDSDEEKMGPSLKGLFTKKEMKSKKPATEENVRQVVKEGGNGMPGYEEVLSAEEMNNLIAYLKTV